MTPISICVFSAYLKLNVHHLTQTTTATNFTHHQMSELVFLLVVVCSKPFHVILVKFKKCSFGSFQQCKTKLPATGLLQFAYLCHFHTSSILGRIRPCMQDSTSYFKSSRPHFTHSTSYFKPFHSSKHLFHAAQIWHFADIVHIYKF